MVFNENEEKPLYTKEDSFEVLNNPSNSSFDSANIRVSSY
jgi:hypothetical protein